MDSMSSQGSQSQDGPEIHENFVVRDDTNFELYDMMSNLDTEGMCSRINPHYDTRSQLRFDNYVWKPRLEALVADQGVYGAG